MASISHKPLAELARAALASALAGEPQPSTDLSELVRRAACDSGDHAVEATHTFFRDVVEPLCDLFDPAATNAYARLFAAAAEQLLPGHPALEILERYRRVRSVRRYSGNPKRVCVLSRVTLGADVAVTSVVLAAAKQRFPNARICFVGPAKNAELFACDPRIEPLSIPYGRPANGERSRGMNTLLSAGLLGAGLLLTGCATTVVPGSSSYEDGSYRNDAYYANDGYDGHHHHANAQTTVYQNNVNETNVTRVNRTNVTSNNSTTNNNRHATHAQARAQVQHTQAQHVQNAPHAHAQASASAQATKAKGKEKKKHADQN